jgi:chromosome segregation ATPase
MNYENASDELAAIKAAALPANVEAIRREHLERVEDSKAHRHRGILLEVVRLQALLISGQKRQLDEATRRLGEVNMMRSALTTDNERLTRANKRLEADIEKIGKMCQATADEGLIHAVARVLADKEAFARAVELENQDRVELSQKLQHVERLRHDLTESEIDRQEAEAKVADQDVRIAELHGQREEARRDLETVRGVAEKAADEVLRRGREAKQTQERADVLLDALYRYRRVMSPQMRIVGQTEAGARLDVDEWEREHAHQFPQDRPA